MSTDSEALKHGKPLIQKLFTAEEAKVERRALSRMNYDRSQWFVNYGTLTPWGPQRFSRGVLKGLLFKDFPVLKTLKGFIEKLKEPRLVP
ncbi:hypothetical protein TNCV_5102971 [Trichonephila clavipes]|nr:hypothetical protein TNCV_5102971 [Trichonephila clavipes]